MAGTRYFHLDHYFGTDHYLGSHHNFCSDHDFDSDHDRQHEHFFYFNYKHTGDFFDHEHTVDDFYKIDDINRGAGRVLYEL